MVRLWGTSKVDPLSWECRATWAPPSQPYLRADGIAFSPEGSLLCLNLTAHSLVFWKTAAPKEKPYIIKDPNTDWADPVFLSENEIVHAQYVVPGTPDDLKNRIRDIPDNTERRLRRMWKDGEHSVLRIDNLRTGQVKEAMVPVSDAGMIYTICCAQNRPQIIVFGTNDGIDGCVYAWDITKKSTGKALFKSDDFREIAVTPDGDALILGTGFNAPPDEAHSLQVYKLSHDLTEAQLVQSVSIDKNEFPTLRMQCAMTAEEGATLLTIGLQGFDIPERDKITRWQYTRTAATAHMLGAETPIEPVEEEKSSSAKDEQPEAVTATADSQSWLSCQVM